MNRLFPTKGRTLYASIFQKSPRNGVSKWLPGAGLVVWRMTSSCTMARDRMYHRVVDINPATLLSSYARPCQLTWTSKYISTIGLPSWSYRSSCSDVLYGQLGLYGPNRMRGCEMKTEKELKKEGRGASDYRVDTKSGLAVVRWLDSSAVQLSSTHVAIQPKSTIKRWDKKQRKHVEVECPAIVKEYNEHMGGVDLFDMLMALYKMDHKSRTWYRRIFFWVLNVATVNGWILYRRYAKQNNVPVKDQLDLVAFTCSISEYLVQVDKLPPILVRIRPGRPRASTAEAEATPAESDDDVISDGEGISAAKKRRVIASNVAGRYDNLGHFPVHSEPKQRCKVCQSYVQMKCMKCNCHLCVTKDKNCYIKFHSS